MDVTILAVVVVGSINFITWFYWITIGNCKKHGSLFEAPKAICFAFAPTGSWAFRAKWPVKLRVPFFAFSVIRYSQTFSGRIS